MYIWCMFWGFVATLVAIKFGAAFLLTGSGLSAIILGLAAAGWGVLAVLEFKQATQLSKEKK